MQDQFQVKFPCRCGLSEKIHNFIIFKKCKKCSMDLGNTFPVSNFLKLMTSMHCSNDTKEADILIRCKLPLNGG